MSKRGPDPEGEPGDYLRAIRDAYKPALGTSEIAEKIGVARQTATGHLEDLVDDDLLETDKIGRVRVWWLTDKGQRYLDPDYDESQ